MRRADTTPGPIVAVTAEDDRYEAARRLAERIADSEQRSLILYDWDSPSLLGEPLPTWWSAEGSEGLFGRRLSVEQLQAAGRGAIARQVHQARSRGLEAWGWLPSDHGPGALADYADEQRATTIVIPEGLEEASGLEALLGATTQPARTAAERARARVVIAGPDAEIADAEVAHAPETRT